MKVPRDWLDSSSSCRAVRSLIAGTAAGQLIWRSVTPQLGGFASVFDVADSDNDSDVDDNDDESTTACGCGERYATTDRRVVLFLAGGPGLTAWTRHGTSGWRARCLEGPSGTVPLILE